MAEARAEVLTEVIKQEANSPASVSKATRKNSVGSMSSLSSEEENPEVQPSKYEKAIHQKFNSVSEANSSPTVPFTPSSSGVSEIGENGVLTVSHGVLSSNDSQTSSKENLEPISTENSVEEIQVIDKNTVRVKGGTLFGKNASKLAKQLSQSDTNVASNKSSLPKKALSVDEEVLGKMSGQGKQLFPHVFPFWQVVKPNITIDGTLCVLVEFHLDPKSKLNLGLILDAVSVA